MWLIVSRASGCVLDIHSSSYTGQITGSYSTDIPGAWGSVTLVIPAAYLAWLWPACLAELSTTDHTLPVVTLTIRYLTVPN